MATVSTEAPLQKYEVTTTVKIEPKDLKLEATVEV